MFAVRTSLTASAALAFAVALAPNALAQEHHPAVECADGELTRLTFSTSPDNVNSFEWPAGDPNWTAMDLGGTGTNVTFNVIDSGNAIDDGAPFTADFIDSTVGAAFTVPDGIPGGDVFIDIRFDPPVSGVGFDIGDVNRSSSASQQGDRLIFTGKTPAGVFVAPEVAGTASATWSANGADVNSTSNSSDELDERVGVTWQEPIRLVRVRWRDCVGCTPDFHGIQLLPIDVCVPTSCQDDAMSGATDTGCNALQPNCDVTADPPECVSCEVDAECDEGLACIDSACADPCVATPDAPANDCDGDGVTVGGGDLDDSDVCIDAQGTAPRCLDSDGDGVTDDIDVAIDDPCVDPTQAGWEAQDGNDCDDDGITVGAGDLDDMDACVDDQGVAPSCQQAPFQHAPLACEVGTLTRLVWSVTPDGVTSFEWPTGDLNWTASDIGGSGTDILFNVVDPGNNVDVTAPFTDAFISTTVGAAFTADNGIAANNVFIDLRFDPPVLGAGFDIADVNRAIGGVQQGDLIQVTARGPDGSSVAASFSGTDSATWQGISQGVNATTQSADEADEALGVNVDGAIRNIRIRWTDCIGCAAGFHGIQLLPIEFCAIDTCVDTASDGAIDAGCSAATPNCVDAECVGCLSDGECGGSEVCLEGACVDACEVAPNLPSNDCDGDGVTVGDGDLDDTDACVDAQGVSPSCIDSDGDGLFDDVDPAPFDPCVEMSMAGWVAQDSNDCDADNITVGQGDLDDNDPCIDTRGVPRECLGGPDRHQPVQCSDGALTRLEWSTTPDNVSTFAWPTSDLNWTATNVGGSGVNVLFNVIDAGSNVDATAPFTDAFISSTEGAAFTASGGIPGGDIFIDIRFDPPVLGVGFDIADVNKSASASGQGDLLLISATTPGGAVLTPTLRGTEDATWRPVTLGTAKGANAVSNSDDEADEELGVTFQQTVKNVRVRWRDCLGCTPDFHGIQLLPIEFCAEFTPTVEGEGVTE